VPVAPKRAKAKRRGIPPDRGASPERAVPAGFVTAQTPDLSSGQQDPAIGARALRGLIQVELTSEIEGWNNQGRFDVVLRGRIISTAPAESFSIRNAEGVDLIALEFGQGEAAEPVTLPSGDIEFRAGFQVYLPMPAGEDAHVVDLLVRARAHDGGAFEEGLRVGCMAGRSAILAGPAHALGSADVPAPRGIVYLESAELRDDGVLLVNGWTLSNSPIVAVQIFVDGERVGAALQGRERGDVGAAYTGYPNSGYSGYTLERVLDARRQPRCDHPDEPARRCPSNGGYA
jgi:hypothetical protein